MDNLWRLYEKKAREFYHKHAATFHDPALTEDDFADEIIVKVLELQKAKTPEDVIHHEVEKLCGNFLNESTKYNQIFRRQE